MSDSTRRQHWPRAMVVAAAFVAMEMVRAPLTVFPLLVEHLRSVGVTSTPSPLDSDASTTVVWLIWLAIEVVTVVVVTDLFENRYGRGGSTLFRAAVLIWAATFGLTWCSMYALGLANLHVVGVALPGSFVEVLILCAIAQRLSPRPA